MPFFIFFCMAHTPFLNVTSNGLINNLELKEETCDRGDVFGLINLNISGKSFASTKKIENISRNK